MAFLIVDEVSKLHEENAVLNGISFSLESGEKLAIAGATGSGKTTLLRIIGGLMQPSSGEILFLNEHVPGPQERLLPGHPQISYLSQHFELRSHYRVAELLQMSSKMEEAEAENIHCICRIDHLLNRWTNQLSGGERQRISLALALVRKPRLLLLDEPYSNLDTIHKILLKEVLDEIGRQLQITTIIVSHEPIDVLSWADTVIVLRNGEMVQKASPQIVYHQPVDEYVAALFGRYNKPSAALQQALGAIKRFIRPSELYLSKKEANGVAATVEEVLFMGSHYEVKVNTGTETLTVNCAKADMTKNETIYLSLLT